MARTSPPITRRPTQSATLQDPPWSRRTSGHRSGTALKFFTLIGEQVAGKIEFVCSDMWRPYVRLIATHCPQALNILDRFHLVAKLDKALDEVRAGEARRMMREGYEPVLEKKRWCLLERPENLADKQRLSLRELLGYHLESVRAYLLEEEVPAVPGVQVPGLGGQVP